MAGTATILSHFQNCHHHFFLISSSLGFKDSWLIEVESLRATVTRQNEKITVLESAQETQADNQLIQLRLIHEIRETSKKGPGKTEISRAEKIERYLSSRPDHRATFETPRGHFGIDRLALNAAIKTLMTSSPGRYGITGTPGDKRKRNLIMLPK